VRSITPSVIAVPMSLNDSIAVSIMFTFALPKRVTLWCYFGEKHEMLVSVAEVMTAGSGANDSRRCVVAQSVLHKAFPSNEPGARHVSVRVGLISFSGVAEVEGALVLAGQAMLTILPKTLRLATVQAVPAAIAEGVTSSITIVGRVSIKDAPAKGNAGTVRFNATSRWRCLIEAVPPRAPLAPASLGARQISGVVRSFRDGGPASATLAGFTSKDLHLVRQVPGIPTSSHTVRCDAVLWPQVGEILVSIRPEGSDIDFITAPVQVHRLLDPPPLVDGGWPTIRSGLYGAVLEARWAPNFSVYAGSVSLGTGCTVASACLEPHSWKQAWCAFSPRATRSSWTRTPRQSTVGCGLHSGSWMVP
jgi:hypothetical protein